MKTTDLNTFDKNYSIMINTNQSVLTNPSQYWIIYNADKEFYPHHVFIYQDLSIEEAQQIIINMNTIMSIHEI